MEYIVNLDERGPDRMPRWFRAIGTASQNVFQRFHGDGIPKSMFHYTTTAALISIVQNNEIWVSDATFLNDRSEVDHGYERAISRLNFAIAEEGVGDVSAMLSLCLGLMESTPKPPVYVASFSWEEDDLGQWRGYGSGGKPVSIELEYGPLMFGRTDGAFCEVRYDAGEQDWIFDQILGAYRASYADDLRAPRQLRPERPISPAEERGICARKLYHDLWRYIVSCKSPAFKSEREVRFVYIAHDFSKDDGSWYPKHPEPMFRESGGRIIPYLSSHNLDYQDFERNPEVPRLPIKSVRIGPTEDQALVARGVRKLLDAYQFSDAEILQSDTPYRG